MKPEGFQISFLEDLKFYEHGFDYRGSTYPFSSIRHVQYTATEIRTRTNLGSDKNDYEVELTLVLDNGVKLKIDRLWHLLSGSSLNRYKAVSKAAAIFSDITFTQRLAAYENAFDRRNYVTWGKYQIHNDGDLFKDYIFLFNLKDPEIRVGLSAFELVLEPKHPRIGQRLSASWKGKHIIDISVDKDCFLYIMKHYFGLTWATQPAPETPVDLKRAFIDATITLGAKIAKSDGAVSANEIKAFKAYFQIDETNHPNAATVFRDAVSSKETIGEAANRLRGFFTDQNEALEYIVIGLISIAGADGVLTSEEEKAIQEVGRVFGLPTVDIDRLFSYFNLARPSDTRSGQSRRNGGNEEGGPDAHSAIHGIREHHLRVLGLSIDSDLNAIKESYRDLARKNHPDLLKAKGVPLEQMRASEEILKTINASYTWLMANMPREK